MVTKKHWSFIKLVTSLTLASFVTSISILSTSCVAKKYNNGNWETSDVVINNESPSSQDIDISDNTNFELFINATYSKGDLSYQWYVNKDNNDNHWEKISGATSNSYKIPNEDLNNIKTKTTWRFKVEIISTKNPNDKITSKVYQVNFEPKNDDSSSTPPSDSTTPSDPPSSNTPSDPSKPTVPSEPTTPSDPPSSNTPSNPSKPTVPSEPTTPSEDQIYNTEEVPSVLSFDYDKVNISDPSSYPDLDFYYSEKITKRYNRTANVNQYQTELNELYKDKGFRYPSYDYNYETENRKYLNVDGQEINVMNLVYNERVSFNGKQVKYNDEAFIKDQIAKNELKVHPAATTWYEQNVTKETQAVEKKFTIGPTKTGLYTLGLYAPAGEVITLTFDDDTYELIKESSYSGLKVVINDNYWDNRGENDTGRISNRYPFVATTFKMDPKSKTLKFGSPFGGNISISISSFLQSNANILNSSTSPISFTVSNAVECLNYVHGYTTEVDWNRQVKDVQNGVITAPNMSAMYSLASMNIPFTESKKVAGKAIDTIIYPYETFKKWNNFQFLSAYTARNFSKMLAMKFCDDIWGGAAAWGGGFMLCAPLSWARSSLLSGVDNFSIKASWGMMHEINHSYQQDLSFFKKMYHNKTNQISIASLAMLSDTGRRRSETNILQEGTTLSNPGWTYLSNSFSSIEKMNKTSGNGEYATYASIVFTIGAKNYMDYTRWDSVNHKNTESGWTGLKEIKALSDYFQVDFWPAFKSTYRIWNDTWPQSYEVADAEQKQIIDELKKYSAIEFVGNLYAAGSYLYNKETNEYRYTGDTNTPYEIPGYQDYTFDFENFINSTNLDFKWSKIIVESNSKNGVPLKVEGKKLNYLASQASYNDDVDEFDITIVPDNWSDKPSNYVPGYKWKIKVRNVIQDARINLYTDVTTWNINSSNPIDEVKKYSATKSFYTKSFSNQDNYEIKNKTNNLLRASFSFIAPSSGKYVFNSLWSNSIDLYVNNSNIKTYHSTSSSSTFSKVYEKQMTKNEVISFEVFVYNDKASCSFDFEIKSNDTTINLSDSLLGFGAYKAWEFVGSSYTFDMYQTDQRFQYKPRFESYLIFTQNANNSTLANNYGFVTPNKNLYTLQSPLHPKININLLYNIRSGNVEIWKSQAPVTFSFDVNFTTPTKVGSLRFGHRTDNHYNARPTDIKVTGIDENGNSKVLYDGDYSTSFSSRSSNSTIVNLNSESVVKTLKIELTNTLHTGLILSWFSYSPDTYVPLNNTVSISNNYIAKTKGWSFINNNDNNYQAISSFGTNSLFTNTKYAAIDLNLKNARAFKLIGTTTTSQSVFDVYINNKIYKRNIKIGGTSENNVELFKYIGIKETDNLRVTIVNKSNNPLIISFIQTFGSKGLVSTSPVIKK